MRGHWLWQRDCDAVLLARQDLPAAEVAAVGDGIEVLRFQCRFRLLGHVRKLRSVGPDIGHFMCDDQMMLGVDGDLDVVAHDTRVGYPAYIFVKLERLPPGALEIAQVAWGVSPVKIFTA